MKKSEQGKKTRASGKATDNTKRQPSKMPKKSTAPKAAMPPRVIKNEQTIELTVRGMSRGVVRMDAQDGTQYACARDTARGALFGDTVLAERIGREGVAVVRVLTRAHEQIMGVLRVHEGATVLQPMERRLPAEIAVKSVGDTGAKDGDIVRTSVVRWEDEGGMLVTVEELIGSFNHTSYALDALVLSQHLHVHFADDVLAQADACRPADPADDPAREDMRELLTFTIDGRDAKDFDDAVSLERLDNGNVRLGVHIADVGFYVPMGTALDKEAFERGTSVYLPGRVLPMLPEQLSNGVCSLRPNEDKFTMSALMEIDDQGCVVSERLARTITRSKARLVYDDVNAFFDGGEQQQKAMEQVADSLLAMRALAGVLRARRERMGSIDFETSEPQFVLDEAGEPVEIIMRDRGEAEMMIEDFMLTANECVARFARSKRVPLLFRVHEKPDPDKLSAFADFLDGIGVNAKAVRHNASPANIRAILENTKERPEYSVITTLALRSMQKARYDTKPLGHYGLAMADYCHFTSPIRRYPDLVVSRAIAAVLMGKTVPLTGSSLADAAVRSSECERKAVDAERAADKLMTARLMQKYIGEEFDGKISGVSEWGMYVTLSNGAEGFVPVRTLSDWFAYDERRMILRGERTGMVFSLGQELRVKVMHVELAQSTIDLTLVEPERDRNRSGVRSERERHRGSRH